LQQHFRPTLASLAAVSKTTFYTPVKLNTVRRSVDGEITPSSSRRRIITQAENANDTQLNTSSELGAPPARKGWRRFRRVHALLWPLRWHLAHCWYLSIMFIPIAAVAAHDLLQHHTQAGGGVLALHLSTGFATFWNDITQPAAISAIRLSLWLSLSVAAIMRHGRGDRLVLVRDKFPASVLGGLHRPPFALPTIVVGVVSSLYGTASPLKITSSRRGWLMLALLFVTLPFRWRGPTGSRVARR